MQKLTCPALRAAAFTNTTSGSEFVSRNGRWLSDPVVVLRANSSSALLQLANPVYDAAAKTVTFQVGRLGCLVVLGCAVFTLIVGVCCFMCQIALVHKDTLGRVSPPNCIVVGRATALSALYRFRVEIMLWLAG